MQDLLQKSLSNDDWIGREKVESDYCMSGNSYSND